MERDLSALICLLLGILSIFLSLIAPDFLIIAIFFMGICIFLYFLDFINRFHKKDFEDIFEYKLQTPTKIALISICIGTCSLYLYQFSHTGFLLIVCALSFLSLFIAYYYNTLTIFEMGGIFAFFAILLIVIPGLFYFTTIQSILNIQYFISTLIFLIILVLVSTVLLFLGLRIRQFAIKNLGDEHTSHTYKRADFFFAVYALVFLTLTAHTLGGLVLYSVSPDKEAPDILLPTGFAGISLNPQKSGDYKEYYSPDLGFSIQYPGNWSYSTRTESDSTASTIFSGADRNTVVIIQAKDMAGTIYHWNSADEWTQVYISNLQNDKTIQKFRVIKNEKAILSGIEVNKIDMTFEYRGVTFYNSVVLVLKDKKSYSLSWITTHDTGEMQSEVKQTMFNSFALS